MGFLAPAYHLDEESLLFSRRLISSALQEFANLFPIALFIRPSAVFAFFSSISPPTYKGAVQHGCRVYRHPSAL